jgi:hypothetical protein
MEFKTVGDRHFFLQYHRSRDFSPATFTLDRPPETHEHEAMFVRGATPPGGLQGKVTLWYPFIRKEGREFRDYHFDVEEIGSYDFHYNWFASERKFLSRSLQFIHGSDLDWELMCAVVGHTQRSKVFKPAVTLINNLNEIFPDVDSHRRPNMEEHTYLTLQVVSDGKKAYISRID